MDSCGIRGRLAPSEQKALIEAAQRPTSATSGAAKERLLRAYEPLMRREIKLAKTPSGLYEDALQAAREGCLEALVRFDLSRGVPFGAYARNYIKGRVLRAVYAKVRRSGSSESSPSVNRVVSLDERLGNSDLTRGDLLVEPGDGIRHVEAGIAFERVRGFVSSLPPRQGYVIRRVFFEGQTQSSVATELGVSGAAVSQLLARVYAKGRIHLADLEGALAA